MSKEVFLEQARDTARYLSLPRALKIGSQDERFVALILFRLREKPRAIPPTPNGYGRTSSPRLNSVYKVLIFSLLRISAIIRNIGSKKMRRIRGLLTLGASISMGFEVWYEPEVNGSRPDFLIRREDHYALIEVTRLSKEELGRVEENGRGRKARQIEHIEQTGLPYGVINGGALEKLRKRFPELAVSCQRK